MQVSSKRWQLWSAACVQRVSIISTEFSPEQAELYKYLKEKQDEESRYSDHELRQKEDQRLEDLRKTDQYDESEVDFNRISAFDLEQTWEAQAAGVTLSDRITEDDKSNNLKSANRILHRPLTLLVKQNLGDKSVWTYPQALWQEGESLRQTAERGLYDLCGMKAVFLGNAPRAYVKYKYPSAIQQETNFIGGKVFIFKAQVLSQNVLVQPGSDIKDYKWLTKDMITENETENPILVAKSRQFVLEL